MTDKTPRRYQQMPPSSDWLDRLTRLNLHFGRYLRDAFGVILIALALMSLLAIWNLTGGLLLTPWSTFLATWFGWGSYLLIAAMTYAGLSLIRRDIGKLNFGRLVALEIGTLLSLGLLAILGGNSLVRAEAGEDGGRLGWGISYLLQRYVGSVWGGVILFLIWILLVFTGLGFWSLLETWLTNLADEPSVVAEQQQIQNNETPDPQDAPGKTISKKQTPKLPPEFRPSLKAPDKKSEKPLKPVPREEGLPPLNILLAEQSVHEDDRTINQTAGMIMKTLSEFGIPATVIGYRVGPTVTQFAVQPGFIKKAGASEDDDAQQMKVRVAQIANLQKDLALALSAERLRIEAPVPGKPYVGIEVPNAHSLVVRMRSILESDVFHRASAPLTIALGRNVSGVPLVADLSRMPHLLIAGATGSGKSVCITALATCLAMNNLPEDLRMIMIDSKMVELLRFNGLPHLYGKVETNIDRILGVLRWVVVEMEIGRASCRERV
jgi:DNA segregation ATPase FtsK/SpoIIIE, S-DNA-T family